MVLKYDEKNEKKSNKIERIWSWKIS
jgi:hypothetical protein